MSKKTHFLYNWIIQVQAILRYLANHHSVAERLLISYDGKTFVVVLRNAKLEEFTGEQPDLESACIIAWTNFINNQQSEDF